MKKLFLFSIILSFFQITAFSQSCLPEGITFSTQSQIDSFQVNYPGCTVIEGDVTIAGNDISSLAGLNILDSILGRLDIGGGYDLTDLSGLESLKYIGESLNVEFCEYLRYFSGLNNLTTINGSLDIEYNDRLTSISGLANLSSVGELVIIANLELVSFSGLGGLDSINGDLSIENNYMLSSLEGLASLAKVGGNFEISFNESISSLSGLQGLNSIGGSLQIYYNNSLASLEGLENINAASISNLWISDNPNLSDCHVQSICEYLADPNGMIGIYSNAMGCDNPHEIADNCGFALSCLPYGNYYFLSQADIDSFPSYYSNCSKLAGSVHINGENIVNLDSLIGIDTINGWLTICGNNNLAGLDGLINLRYIQNGFSLGYWECGNNPQLTSLRGLNNLTAVGGAMLIMWNSALINLEGLDSLTTVGEGFEIYTNSSLKSLEGINNLKASGSMEIQDNDSLVSLNGLQGLINVHYGIEIGGNPMLKAIDGIENVDVDSLWFLTIYNNKSLSECSTRSVCNYLDIPDGNIEIHDNATGCNSQEEVELACLESVEEVVSHQSLVVSYPNPVTDRATFIIRLLEPAKVNLTIFNNMGQIVATILDESLDKGDHLVIWNSEGRPPGIYYYRISTNDHRQSAIGKMVVVR